MDGWMDQNQEACIFEKLDVRHCHTISKVKLMCMQGSTNDPKKIMIFNEKHDVEWPKQHWFYLFSKNGLPRNQMPKMEISFIKFHWKKIKKNIMYNQNNTGFIRCHSKINRLLCKTKPFQKLQAIVMITNQESIFLAKVLLDLVWSSKSIRTLLPSWQMTIKAQPLTFSFHTWKRLRETCQILNLTMEGSEYFTL